MLINGNHRLINHVVERKGKRLQPILIAYSFCQIFGPRATDKIFSFFLLHYIKARLRVAILFFVYNTLQVKNDYSVHTS